MASRPACDHLEDVNDEEETAGVEEAPRLVGGEGWRGSGMPRGEGAGG